MKNSTYWKKRFNALANGQYRKSAGFVDQLQKKFDVTRRELEDKINSWYARFGANTGQVTLADAKKLLKADELEELHWTLKEYREYAKTHGLEPEWIDKLENASAKKHISRLESIKLQMEQLEEKLYAEYNNECYGYLGELVKDSYYRTAFEISKGVGIGTNLHRINEKMVEKYLTRPWCQDGKVFSDRIWTRKDEMIRTLDTELTKQLIIGSDPQKAIDKIADKFNVSKRQAGTLVMTESAAIASEASKDCMKDLGVEEYEISATLDSHTSEICQEMDGKHFNMSEYTPGLNAPPFHPNCRSTTVPYFDDEFTLDETRAARDKNDEGYERVPADMKYKEWKEKYIDGKEPDDVKYTPEQIESYKKQLTDIDGRITELRKQEEDITGYKHDEYLEYLKKNGSSVDKEFEGYEDEKKAYDDIQDQIRKLEEQKKAIPYDAIEEIDKTIEKQPEDGIIKTDRDYDSDLCKGLGKEHYDNIHDKLDNCGDEDFIRVWNANEKDIRVADASSGKNYANDKGIYINEEKDAKGNAAKEPYQSTIHESAHRIDRLNADKGSGEGNHFSSTYQDGAFLDAISSDVKNLIDDREKIILKAIEDHPGDWKWLYSNNYIDAWAYDLAKMGGEVKYERRWAENLLVKEIKSLPKKTQSSLSDIVEGATMGRVIVLGGHKQTYWKDHLFKGINEGLATETNSHFAETIGANHEAYNYLKKWMPKTNDIWHEMMKALASK